MAKFLMLKNAAGVKVAEVEVADRPSEHDVITVEGVNYKIFRSVSPNLKRGADIVFRAVVTLV